MTKQKSQSTPYHHVGRASIKNISHTYTTTVTAEDVYLETMVNIPNGFVGVAFRPPNLNEFFLDLDEEDVQCEYADEFSDEEPRIILEKIKFTPGQSTVINIGGKKFEIEIKKALKS